MLEGTTLGPLDLAFFASSLAVTVLIGLYFANKNKTFSDYARGGGDQNLWAVSASMAAGYCSALTLIGNPSELYLHGASFTFKMATTLLSWPLSAFLFLPLFKRLDNISIFQFIELRYNAWLRRFISLLFISQMLFYSAVALYLPSLPLQAALKIPPTLSISLVGFTCILYSSFGGIKAVTWTNLYHSLLLLLAMLAIIGAGLWRLGGPAALLARADDDDDQLLIVASGRLALGADFLRLDLATRHTLYNSLFGYTLVRLFLHGTSQMQVQSALSLSSLRRGQLAQLISALFYVLIQMIASSIGLLLYLSYRHCDPYASGQIKRPDELLVHYVSTQLSGLPAMQGLFMAAICGSTLTSMSSFQSSTSAMVVDDFVRPLFGRLQLKLSAELAARLGKTLALALGLCCVLLTYEMDKISGLQQATTTLYGVIGMPILAAFLMGACTRFISPAGVFAGMLASILFGLHVFLQQLQFSPIEASLATSVSGCGPAQQLATKSYAHAGNSTAQAQAQALSEQQAEATGDPGLAATTTPTTAPTILESIGQMSYLWLPLFTLTIACCVASLVSLASRWLGCEQWAHEDKLAREDETCKKGKESAIRTTGGQQQQQQDSDLDLDCKLSGQIIAVSRYRASGQQDPEQDQEHEHDGFKLKS